MTPQQEKAYTYTYTPRQSSWWRLCLAFNCCRPTPDRSAQWAVLHGGQGGYGHVLTFFCAAETLTIVLDLLERRTWPARLATP